MRKSVLPRESLAPTGMRGRQAGPLQFSEVGNIKESRNFKDKSIFSHAAHSLLSFLEDSGFPQAITIKNLEQPTTALVAQIFKFMMSKVTASYDMGQARLEEEFPKAMADLHYPYPLKKSHVQSATTPSGWIVVFGAFHWLYENMEYITEELQQRDNKPWRDYYGKLYEGFLYQKPVSTDAVENMRRLLSDEAKLKKQRENQMSGKAESLQNQLSDLEAQGNEMTNIQQKINEDNTEILRYRPEIDARKQLLLDLENKEEQRSRQLLDTETEWSLTSQTLEKLKDAISQQAVDKNVITTTRNSVQQLKFDIGDAEQDIEHYVMLAEDTIADVNMAKAPVEDSLARYRSGISQLLSQLSRLSISIDPVSLGMSLPSNPAEQFQHFKNIVKLALSELSDTLNEEYVKAKQKHRDFSGAKAQLDRDHDHVKRDLEFLETQRQRLIDEERQFMEREEKRLYEWRSQAEEQAAKRRVHISDLDARNQDRRHRIATLQKETDNEIMVLQDRSRTYEQVLTHISNTATDSYKPVTERMLGVLMSIRDSQQRETEFLRRGIELMQSHPLLVKSLNEELAERKITYEDLMDKMF